MSKIYDILSLDLWDTVIRRKCHPDQIKMNTSKYILMNYFDLINAEYRDSKKIMDTRIECERRIGSECKKKGLDDEYEIHDVFYQLFDYISDVPSELKESIVNDLYNFELQEEINNDYLDPTIEETVSKYEFKQLAYVSDFYAGHEFIDAILDKIGCSLKFDRKYISCECGYNKRSGKLFEYVLKDLGIEEVRALHMGDNQYSDVEVPKQKGIETIHYMPAEEHRLRTEREKEFRKTLEDRSATLEFGKLEAEGDISIFFYGFIKWIMESCKQEGIENIYFFTREGEFYKQIYDEIIINQRENEKYPKAEILEASRIATFCASLREITLEELMRIWNQYSIQPLSALFKSLDISKDKVIQYIDKYKIGWDEVITYPWLDERVIDLFQNKDFISTIVVERDEKRKLLLQYLEQKGLRPDNPQKIAIVDIGWRGTIQDNISYLLPEHYIKGYYIGLIPFLNEQPSNVVKRGYLNGYEHFDMLLKYVMPFEMICNSPNGSTVNYEMVDGIVKAVRKKEKEEDDVYYRYIEGIQNSIISDMKQLCNSLNEIDDIVNIMRPKAHEVLSNYVFRPQRVVANAYFSLKHNEEFGVGEYVDKTTKFCWKLFFKAFFGRKHRSNFAQFLRDTTWPQGYLVKYRLYPILSLYNERYADK